MKRRKAEKLARAPVIGGRWSSHAHSFAAPRLLPWHGRPRAAQQGWPASLHAGALWSAMTKSPSASHGTSKRLLDQPCALLLAPSCLAASACRQASLGQQRLSGALFAIMAEHCQSGAPRVRRRGLSGARPRRALRLPLDAQSACQGSIASTATCCRKLVRLAIECFYQSKRWLASYQRLSLVGVYQHIHSRIHDSREQKIARDATATMT